MFLSSFVTLLSGLIKAHRSRVEVRVSRLIVEEQGLGEVLLVVGHVTAADNSCGIIERRVGEGDVTNSEVLLIVQLSRRDVRVVCIVVILRQITAEALVIQRADRL